VQKKIVYRKALLRAIDAFLEGTSSSHIRAKRIIQRCYVAKGGEENHMTLNSILWSAFIVPLTDSIFYENKQFLRETREKLLGNSSQNITRTIFRTNYRVYFTTDEAQWYAQLISMLDFILTTPFAKIHEATNQEWQNKATWATIRPTLPEAVQAEKRDEEYLQRKALLEQIAARSQEPEDVGDEKIYHLLLQEATSILTAISVGYGAIASGYPVVAAPYSDYRDPQSSKFETINATERLEWAKKVLDALAGKGDIFISWRLGRASTFDGDLLLVFFH
jgi:hypothetical protein